MKKFLGRLLSLCTLLIPVSGASAQELLVNVNVNHSKIQSPDQQIFESLQKNIFEFLNNRQWTSARYDRHERIKCNLNITVEKYDKDTGAFTCKAVIQANRPVFDTDYTTVVYGNMDNNFNFEYRPFDRLEFNLQNIDQPLTALLAYYAYLIIGMDMDTFAPNGGEKALQTCVDIVNNAQNLDQTGWKSFDDRRNRSAIINDYMDPTMSAYRKLQYDYYRKGLDIMAENPQQAMENMVATIAKNLNECHQNKPLSLLPQIWTDYKKDELVEFLRKCQNREMKQKIQELLININAGQSNYWDKINQ